MSVLVSGMEMPKSCEECKLKSYDAKWGDICPFTCVVALNIGRQNSCPLVELPEKHGRLIDADALEPDSDYDDGEYWAISMTQIENAPTVIEAEGTNEGSN